jgi:BirA family biotin operon repressor/biotin-[acetyl-CoA-carboxylase] ligase
MKILHFDTVTSTMDAAREAAQGELIAELEEQGLVVWAEHQSAGRGRTAGRPWSDAAGKDLCFTLVRRFKALPPILTLRIGLAVAQTIDGLAAEQKAGVEVKVKWPNDVMLNGKKTCGILTEAAVRASAATAYIGVGLNMGQTAFPPELRATSLALEGVGAEREALLKALLRTIDAVLGLPPEEIVEAVNVRLYKKDEIISFRPGAANSGELVTGRLVGISSNGGIIINSGGKKETFINGEILLQ